METDTLDKSFEALKTFDWGTDRNRLNPIDDAVVAAHGNPTASKELETRLAAMLKPSASRSVKDFVCRALRVIGTAESVPTLAEFLPDKDNSHMARYALERIPAPEAAAAMRDALPKVTGSLKIGVISSLGARRDAESVPALAALLTDPNKAVAAAAAHALGNIGTLEAARALEGVVDHAPVGVEVAVADARLACAEQLLAGGQKSAALAIYKSLGASNQPKHVALAAKRGLLAALKKK